MRRIYLDYNATAPVLPEVVRAMSDAYAQCFANPASQHAAGRRARRVIEDARDEIAAIAGLRTGGASADRVVFTSGGSEANNLALLGLVGVTPATVIISAIEHPCVHAPAELLKARGWKVLVAPVRSSGEIDVDAFEALLDANAGAVRLVSLMLASNETGVIQPIQQCAALARSAGAIVHTDAVQVFGKLPVDLHQLGVDAITISGHKFHGPKGIGALLLRAGVQLSPVLVGGQQQLGLRPGTEPVELVLGMQRAIQLCSAEQGARVTHMQELRDRFESTLRAGWPQVVINSDSTQRLPNTSNVSFCGLDRQALVVALDLAGIACSTGSACASGSSEPSPTLLAMRCSPEVVEGSLRFSLGANTTADEIDEATDRILRICRNLKPSARCGKSLDRPRTDSPISL